MRYFALKLILFLAFASAAFGQCNFVYNPLTQKLDCAASGGNIQTTTSILKGDGAGSAIAVSGTGTNCVQVNGSSTACGSGSPGGSTTDVQSNQSGAFSGDGSLTYTTSASEPKLAIGAASVPVATNTFLELGPSYLITARKNLGTVSGFLFDATHEDVVDANGCAGTGCQGFYFETMTAYNANATPTSKQLGSWLCDAGYLDNGTGGLDDCGVSNDITGKFLWYVDLLGTQSQVGNLEGTFYAHNFVADGTVTSGSGSVSGALLLPGKTSGNSVTITVTDTTAAGTLTAPGGLTATIMPFTGAFANGDCVKAAVSGAITSFITTGSGCAAGNPANYWSSGGSVGIGPTSFTPTGSLYVYDATASTGYTLLTIKEGVANQSGTFEMFTVLNNSNTEITGLSDLGGGDARLKVTGIASEADTYIMGQTNGANFKAASNWQFLWQSAGNWFSGSTDLQLSRASASVLAVGSSGSAGDTGGSVKLASLVSGGTKFTASGCSNSTTVGGATAGTYLSGTTGACTVVITLNGATGLTAPNGWTCSASDLTTPANLISQSASSTTTCTVTGTTISGDKISFLAIAF